MVEYPGVALTCAVLTIEEEIKPHGRVKELATQIAFMAKVAVTGVNEPRVIYNQ